jgi:diguanylate cyclase (GGDEF)-like protein
MSLIKQLWIAIALVMTIAFGGSLLVSVLSARHYLEQQLQVKNIDNATSLALSLSQLDKDPVTIDLQISAQFDAGHYRFIRIQSPNGAVLAERVFKGALEGAPSWFVSLIPIHAEPGRAQVLDGWKQFGTLTLASHDQYVYKSLWQGTIELLVWFLVGSISLGLAGTLAIRSITRPLRQVVEQADAIAKRQFVTIAEPRTPEMRSMTRALNDMVGRLKAMFADEAARLESLRRRINHDSLTGVGTREFFMSNLRETLDGEQAAPSGSLALVALADLIELNARLGHRRVDEVLQSFGQLLTRYAEGQAGSSVGRLRGSEFAIVIPGDDSPAQVAKCLNDLLAHEWLPTIDSKPLDMFHVGVVPFHRGDSIGDLLTRLEQMLAQARSKGPNQWQALESVMPRLTLPAERWRKLLTDAAAGEALSLAFFPVRDGGGQKVLHQEAVLRMRPVGSEVMITAGEFLPMAAHLGMTAPIDLAMIRLALEHLKHTEGDLAVNLSIETVTDFHFRNQLILLLQSVPSMCGRLLFEVPEYGVFRQFDAFRDLARSLKQLGCRVGIEYFGQHLVDSDKLSAFGLDYIKLNPALLGDLDENPGNQELVKGICGLAHALGIQVIALGVQNAKQLPLLVSLGVDGATGPGLA